MSKVIEVLSGIVGVCVECCTDLKKEDSLSEEGYPDIYECSECGHPNVLV